MHFPAAIDIEGGARDVFRPVGGQKSSHLANVLRRLGTSKRNATLEPRPVLLLRLALQVGELGYHRCRSVARMPGWIELTVLLCGASSEARLCVMPVTANFDAT